MEDVVVHLRDGGADTIRTVTHCVEITGKLLEPFPCRPTTMFVPWFLHTAGSSNPIRPSCPAPRITHCDICPVTPEEAESEISVTSGPPPCPNTAARNDTAASDQVSACGDVQQQNVALSRMSAEGPPASPDVEPFSVRAQRPYSSPPCLLGAVSSASPDKCSRASPTRTWMASAGGGTWPPGRAGLSLQLHQVVLRLRLQARQRAHWVLCLHNCGKHGDVEQVWRCLRLLVRFSGLPACNATLRREQREIWVFCDLLHSELVGRFLKDKLGLSGTINLSVHRHTDIFSM